MFKEDDGGGGRLPSPGQVLNHQRHLPGGGGRDQGGRAGGGGEVCGVHHRLQDQVAPSYQVFQQCNLQAWDCVELTHLGMQSEEFWIQSELENPGSWPAIQSSDKNMQTLCARTVLYSQKTPPSLPEPQAGDRHHLSTHQNVSPQKCGESESPRLKTWSRFAFNLHQYQFVSPDDWSNPWNMPVEKIKIDLIWEVIAYIDVVMVRGLNKEGVSGKLWVVIANWKSIHNQYSIIFQFLHDKLFWQKITFL